MTTQEAADLPSNTGTAAVREAFRFDERRLEAYLRAHVQGFRPPMSVRQFTGGQSNPTYLLLTPDRSYVMRRKPPGPLLPSAHAIDREYHVMTALADAAVPVPRTFTLCMDESVIGTSFFVMEHVSGRIFWDVSLPEVPREERPAYFDAMNAAIASLHNADPAALGLGDFGKPGNYIRRQIRRWSAQYLGEQGAGRVRAMDDLIEWLAARAPDSQEVAIVHGDFRCDNLVFHPREPRVIAILDWELSTLGHPLADFAYYLTMYYLPQIAVSGLAGKDLVALNIPPLDWCIRTYCERTGRDSIPALGFYVVFNLFRFAAICHGIRGRLARGNAVSARAQEYAAAVEGLAELAREQARQYDAQRRS